MAWPSDKSSRGTYGKYVVFPGSRATFLRVHHRFVRMTAPLASTGGRSFFKNVTCSTIDTIPRNFPPYVKAEEAFESLTTFEKCNF